MPASGFDAWKTREPEPDEEGPRYLDPDLDAIAAERAVQMVQEYGPAEALRRARDQILKLDRDTLPEQRDDDAVEFWSLVYEYVERYRGLRAPRAHQRKRRRGVA